MWISLLLALCAAAPVTVGSGEWQLPGTLLVPAGKGPFPGVVLVHGAGPDDRDETIYSNHMFKDIAEGLVAKGFAVLRYDKRTFVYGAQMAGMSYTLQEETVADAVLALGVLRAQPKGDPKRIFVIAHSLGGYALPRIAKQDGKLAGAIVLAGNARPIEDVVLDQASYSMEVAVNTSSTDRMRFARLKEEVEKVKRLQSADKPPAKLMGLPLAYFNDLKDYHPAVEMKTLALPVLFLQGERDFQVTMKDFQIWKSELAGRPKTTFKTYPALNHMFMPGQGKPNPAEYRIESHVTPEAINDMAAWLALQR